MYLSKSQYLRGLQCHKALWLYRYRRESMTPPDAAAEARFASGHAVGKLAQSLFPGGVEIEHDAGDYIGMIERTARLVEAGAAVIYEAAFREQGVFVMVDILVRDGDRWNIYEVKSTTGVKPYHEDDLAIQWYVLARRLPLGRACIVHLDRRYEFHGALEIGRLFAIADLTETVREGQAATGRRLAAMQAMLDGAQPDLPIGPYCSRPFDCDFKAHCWADVPYPSVFDLHRLAGARKFEYFRQGFVTYRDLEGQPLNAVQSLQVSCGISRRPHVDARRLRAFLDRAEYPLHFLDFETFAEAVPRYDGERPYMQIPFQYSLHVVHADGELEHREFLAEAGPDPRPAFAARLVGDIAASGSIVAFNAAFERGVVGGLAARCRGHAAALGDMQGRFVDLLAPFRELMYYHPDMNGSFSIKSIYPALFADDDGYRELEIHDGEMANAAYAGLAAETDPAARERTRAALLAYCRLDTLAMVKIWRRLEDEAG